MAHAATPWTPPTADQPGLIGPNWSKGWIIEHNIIHDSKRSAISLGKEASTGNNYRSIRKDKPGYQYQLESVFSAKRNGWSKENIGSHIVRYNTVYNCGQNGIVGHLGCVFSEVHHNHIYNIALKREFYGYEIAGISSMPPSTPTSIKTTYHECTLGIWCDWQEQGTRISKKYCTITIVDLSLEVKATGIQVDNNIFASNYSIDNWSQGGAYINNLFCGKINLHKVLNRSTQYHLPHSTEIKGFSLIYGGDDRFFNNIFIGNKDIISGTAIYNGHTASLEEYIEKANEKNGDLEQFAAVEQPVYINCNALLHGAEAFERRER